MLRKTQLRRKSRLRPRSKRMSARMRKYMMLRALFLKEHPLCEIWLRRNESATIMEVGVFAPNSTEIHHSAGRGKNLLNVATWVACCREQHRWLHSHPKEARAIGLLA